MSVSTLQLYSQQPNGVTFCDPLKPDMTVRFKTTSSQKVLDGLKVQNFITEITSNDNHSVAIGASNVTDALSVKIRTSGSLQSRARIKEMLLDLAAKMETWEGENVLIGFTPATAPVNTTA